MAKIPIGTGVVDTELDLSGLNAGLRKAHVAITALGAALVETIRRGLNIVRRLESALARVGGRGSASILAMNRILEESGANVDQLLRRIPRLFARVSRAEGAEALEKLGLSLQQLYRLSREEQLIAIADGLAAISDEAERAAIGQALLGRSFADVLLLTSDNVEEHKDLLGVTDDEYRAVSRLHGALEDLEAAFAGFAVQLAAAVAPAIEGVVSLFQSFITLIGKLPDQILFAASAIVSLISTVGLVVLAIKAWQVVIGGATGAGKGFVKTIASLSAAILRTLSTIGLQISELRALSAAYTQASVAAERLKAKHSGFPSLVELWGKDWGGRIDAEYDAVDRAGEETAKDVKHIIFGDGAKKAGAGFGIGAMLKSLGVMLAKLAAVVASIAAVAASFWALGRGLKAIYKTFKGGLDFFKDWAGVAEALYENIKGVRDFFKDWVGVAKSLYETIKGGKSFFEIWADLFKSLYKTTQSGKNLLERWFGLLKSLYKALYETVRGGRDFFADAREEWIDLLKGDIDDLGIALGLIEDPMKRAQQTIKERVKAMEKETELRKKIQKKWENITAGLEEVSTKLNKLTIDRKLEALEKSLGGFGKKVLELERERFAMREEVSKVFKEAKREGTDIQEIKKSLKWALPESVVRDPSKDLDATRQAVMKWLNEEFDKKFELIEKPKAELDMNIGGRFLAGQRFAIRPSFEGGPALRAKNIEEKQLATQEEISETLKKIEEHEEEIEREARLEAHGVD